MPALPNGMVTFLIRDIEDSTKCRAMNIKQAIEYALEVASADGGGR